MLSDTGLVDVFNQDVIANEAHNWAQGGNDVDVYRNEPCFYRIESIRQFFKATLQEIVQPGDREACFVLMYIAARVRWILLDTRIAYGHDSGTVDNSLGSEARLLARLIGRMEKRLTDEKTRFVSQFLLRAVDETYLEVLDKEGGAGFYEQVRLLTEELKRSQEKVREHQESWDLLEARIGSRSAREVIELVQGLKDRGAHRDRFREPSGAAAQLEQLIQTNAALEREALRWQQGQEFFLRELGDTDPQRIVERFRQMQETIARLTVGIAGPEPQETESLEAQDLEELLQGIYSTLRELPT